MTLPNYDFKQKNNWTCGPAVARMVLHYFGKRKHLPELVKELRATRNGTSNAPLLRLLKKHGLKFRVKRRADAPDLKKRLRKHLVVVAYWIPYHRESHYSIVKKMDAKRIYLHDPWFGSNHSYTLNYFLKNWWDEEATRWLLAVKK